MATAVTALVGLGLLAQLPAQTAEEVPRVEVDPNAIQQPDRPMAIRVHGIAEGQTLWLEVLQDCDGDDRPERHEAGCASPLRGWQSGPAARGLVSTRLEPAELATLPPNRGLWLWAARDAQTPRGGLARFGVVDDACSLWRTAVDVFFGGVCDPHLAQALRRHRGESAGMGERTFEVRRLQIPAEVGTPLPAPIPVAATRGASGVAWLDAATLLVTIATPPAGAAGPSAGLYRVPLNGPPEPLWTLPAGDPLQPTAPRALPGGRVAFVRQQLAGTPAPTVRLSVWHRGELERELHLPDPAHQIVAADAAGTQLLLVPGTRRRSALEVRLSPYFKGVILTSPHRPCKSSTKL